VEVALLPQHHFVTAIAISYSTIHGNLASEGDWKKTKVTENAVVSKWKGKGIKMGKQAKLVAHTYNLKLLRRQRSKGSSLEVRGK
jgi:hypothetical protein